MPRLQASFCWSHYVTSKISSLFTFSRTCFLHFELSIFPIIPSACGSHWIHSLHQEPMVLGLFLRENASMALWKLDRLALDRLSVLFNRRKTKNPTASWPTVTEQNNKQHHKYVFKISKNWGWNVWWNKPVFLTFRELWSLSANLLISKLDFNCYFILLLNGKWVLFHSCVYMVAQEDMIS